MKTKVATPDVAQAIAQDAIPRKALAGVLQTVARKRKLTREAMADLVDDAPSQVSRVVTGWLTDLSADRMVKWVTRLGYNVTIQITRAPKGRGKVRVEVRGV